MLTQIILSINVGLKRALNSPIESDRKLRSFSRTKKSSLSSVPSVRRTGFRDRNKNIVSNKVIQTINHSNIANCFSSFVQPTVIVLYSDACRLSHPKQEKHTIHSSELVLA